MGKFILFLVFCCDSSIIISEIFLYLLKNDFIYLFLERKEGRERERERNVSVREKH